MTDNKLAATFHPHTTPTPDDPSPLDPMERDGFDDTNVHGYWRGLLIAFGVIVGSWVIAGGFLWWAMTSFPLRAIGSRL